MKFFAASGFAFTIACASAFAAADAWPQFRGPGGQGISIATNVPVEWSSSNRITWKVAVPGRGWSSPVVAAGKIYLTSAEASGGPGGISLRALCFSAADGKLLWITEVLQPDAASVVALHKKNSQASATPIVTGDRLYVHFGHLGTAALDLSGKVLWRQTTLNYSPFHGNGGSPELVGDALVISCDGSTNPIVVALSRQTGDVRWKTPRVSPVKNRFSFSTPLTLEVGGEQQIISPGSGFVGAYRPADGCELWRVNYGEGFSVVPRPVFAHGLVFICTGFNTASLLGIKPAGARGDVTGTNVAWSHRKGVPTTSSPIVLGDEIYFVSDGGVATCLNARTGEVYWNERLGGDFSASPVAAEGRLYFQNETGTGFVLKAGRTFALLATNNLAERTLASVVVVDNALFIRSEAHLWCIGKP